LSIPEFYVDNDYIWVASWNNGVYVQNNPVSKNRETPELQKKILFADDEFSCFASFNENFMLAGGRSTGMYVINKKTFAYERLYHDRSNTFSLAANQVTCMLADKNNILWIGTSGGLSKYNPVQWQFHAQPVSENFEKEIRQFSIHENEDGGLSICTADGLYMKSKTDSAFHLREYYYQGKKLSPTSIHKLDDGRYLMTTEDNSFWYQPQTSKLDILYPEKYFGFVTNEFYKYNPMTRGSYQVRFIEQGTVQGHSLLYFGTMGWGLGIYDETDNIYYDLIRTNDKKSLGNNLVRTMLKDSQSDVWLGTADGLYKWNKSVPPKNDFEAYVHLDTDSTSISNNNITGLYEDKNHHLWISTANGLNEFDGKRFYHYIPRFKSSKNMYGIYADEKNNLCTAVPDGFEIFNLNTKTFHHVTIPNNEWLLKYAAQIMKHSNGDWMYGAGNFVITFNTAQYVSETAFPEIYLTGFSVFDKKIFETEEFNNLKFKHNNNFFTITFSSLQLSQPSTVKYQYWLKGLNDQWIDIGNDEKIVFTSLPPGKFQLYAKVTNAQGAWSVAKELVTFTVSSPYWQQWWFFVLCAALIGLAVYAFIKLREKQYLQLQTMRNKIANDLHDDVGSALSTINLYSEVAKMKTEKENEELKTILDKISNTSIEMQENMSHIVWSLQPRNDEFEQMILRLKRYAVENMQAKNIKTEFSIDEKLQELKMSPEKRKELFLIYKEALHNILKYANCTEVKILFSKTKHEMQMQIQDNGAGFDITEKFTGNGLHTMHERAKALQGKLILNSQPGKGTSVMLQFPL
jgi:signal transduction histidine kinase